LRFCTSQKKKMKKLQNKLLLFGLVVLFTSVAPVCFAQDKKETRAPIEVKAGVDRTIVSIGDKLRYTIIIEKTKDIEIEPFVFGENLGNFAIKDFGSNRNVFFNKEKISQWYILDTYTTGKTTIPKAVINYKRKTDKDWSQLETGEILVEVKSLLDKAGSDTMMRDIKGPVGLPWVINKYLVLATLFLLTFLGILAGYFLKKNQEEQAISKKPAHEIAYAQLEGLRAKNYIALHRIKEYYTEISDIIRHYLENRFQLRAPEMTTEEFLIKVRDSSELISEHKNLLREFLLCCDLVKFAKYAPTLDEVNSIFDSAKHFIDQTKENEPA
jgi:hypothetical protein